LSDLSIETPRAFLPLLNDDARYLAAHGGRGSAKSHFFGELLVERCLMNEGTRWLCVREHQVSLRNSVKPLVEAKIEKFKAAKYFEVLNNEIRTPGGGVIVFTGMKNHTSESIKSFEDFDGAWCEEAQSISALSWERLRPTIRKPRSQIWAGWNPRFPTDPVDSFFRKDKVPNACVIEVSYRDNPFFPDVLREEMEYDRRRDPDRFKHVWLGGYDTKSQARVITRWKIGTKEEIEGIKRAAKRPRYGLDFGFAKDPTAAVELWADVATKRIAITAEAWKIGCEIDATPILLRTAMPNAHEWPIRADSARPETISYLKRNGFPKITPAIKGANSVKEGVEFIKNYDLYVDESCTHTIDELTLYSYEIDPQTQEVLPKLEDENNHLIDALRYAVEDLRRSRIGVF
jgi:phage terminase large subunit